MFEVSFEPDSKGALSGVLTLLFDDAEHSVWLSGSGFHERPLDFHVLEPSPIVDRISEQSPLRDDTELSIVEAFVSHLSTSNHSSRSDGSADRSTKRVKEYHHFHHFPSGSQP